MDQTSMRTAPAIQTIPAFDLRRQLQPLESSLLEATRQVIRSGQFILGPHVRELETTLARQLAVRHAIGVANGTDALYLALRACGIGPGDDVVTTPFTFVATGTSIVRAGARPVFADIDPDTLNLAPQAVARALTPTTRAILVVHLYGTPADMGGLQEVTQRHGIQLIEDMAQAIGARWEDRPVGSIGRAAALSFYPTKNLGAAGDGGLVATSDDAVAQLVAMLRVSGQQERYMCEDAAGINSRLDELQAAWLLIKLAHWEGWTERRRAIAQRYREGLAGLPVTLPPADPPGVRSVYHQFTIRTPARDRLVEHLGRHGIGTAIYYPAPLHQQPGFAGIAYLPQPLPVAERAAREAVSLPMFPELTDAEVDRVVDAVRGFFRDAAG